MSAITSQLFYWHLNTFNSSLRINQPAAQVICKNWPVYPQLHKNEIKMGEPVHSETSLDTVQGRGKKARLRWTSKIINPGSIRPIMDCKCINGSRVWSGAGDCNNTFCWHTIIKIPNIEKVTNGTLTSKMNWYLNVGSMSVCADWSAHNIHIGLENWKFVGNSVLCHSEAESRPGNVQALLFRARPLFVAWVCRPGLANCDNFSVCGAIKIFSIFYAVRDVFAIMKCFAQPCLSSSPFK